MDIERWAEAHHGVITRRVVRAAGLSDAAIEWRLRTGRWERVFDGVYRVVGSPPTWEQIAYASVLNGGGDAAGSHSTSARLWSLRLWAPDDPIEITVPYTSCIAGHHRSTCLFESDRARRNGIPVTSLARTLIDLSARHSIKDLGLALDEAVHRKAITYGALRSCADRLSPAPGRRLSAIHRLLAQRIEGYDQSESALEDRMFRLIAKAGMPLPRQQYTVRIDGRRYRLDAAWPEFKVGVEADGFPHRWRSVFDSDRVRSNKLGKIGWEIQRFTSQSDECEFIADLWDALTLRGWSRKAV